MEWCVVVVVWLYILTDALASALVCNYCYAADWKSDCYLNTQSCGEEHVCFSEKSTVLGRNPSRPAPHVTYRMGCEHFSLCLDRVTYGERSSGFTVTNRTCCCRSLCEEPDGVGQGDYEHCPPAWLGKCRQTLNTAATFIRASYHRPTLIVLVALALLFQ